MKASMNTFTVLTVASGSGETFLSARPSISARTITPITLPPSVKGPITLRGSFSRICSTLSPGPDSLALVSAVAICPAIETACASTLALSESERPRRSPGRMKFATRSPIRIATSVLVASSLTSAPVFPCSILAPASACTMAKNATGAASICTRPIRIEPGLARAAASGPMVAPQIAPIAMPISVRR